MDKPGAYHKLNISVDVCSTFRNSDHKIADLEHLKERLWR